MKLREAMTNNVRLVAHLLNKTPSLPSILADSRYRIIDCSRSFEKMIGDRPLGQYLTSILKPISEDGKIVPAFSTEEHLFPRICKLKGSDIHLNCFAFKAEDNVLIFAERFEASDTDIVRQVSEMNDELYNKTIELVNKNRQLEKANARIQKLMQTDPLTGLANRRYFNQRFETDASFSRRNNHPLSLVMADLDRFKSVNDNYGHDAGDEVLMGFADLISANCRTEDLPARFGGEEFIILLPGTGLNKTLQFCERIRKKMEKISFREGKIRVTVSMGAALFTRDDTLEHLVKRADQALYRAKQNGRNRCEKQ